MASIIYNDHTFTQQRGTDLLGQLLNQGADVQYICMSGSCGTCKVAVVSGTEHLMPLTGTESMLGCKPGERLACQAVCKGTGDITIAQ